MKISTITQTESNFQTQIWVGGSPIDAHWNYFINRQEAEEYIKNNLIGFHPISKYEIVTSRVTRKHYRYEE